MTNEPRTILITDEDEIAILIAADRARHQAMMRADSHAAIFRYNEEESSALDQKYALEETYRKKYNLVVPPRLSFNPLVPYQVPEAVKEQAKTECEPESPVVQEDPPCEEVVSTATSVHMSSPTCALVQNPNNSLVPMTIPCTNSNISTQIATHTLAHLQIANNNRRRLTDKELEMGLLGKYKLKRVSSVIYCHNKVFYHRMHPNELETLVHDYLFEVVGVDVTSRQVKEVIKLLTEDGSIQGTPLENQFGLVNLLNGAYDIIHGTLQESSDAWFFTSALLVNWDSKAECPVFDRFLHQVTGGNPAMIARFYEAIGYALVPDQRGKRFLFLHGESNTGKSVLSDLLASFFPCSCVSSVGVNELNGDFGYAGLVGKSLNICAELSSSTLPEEAVRKIKALTGGDTVNVNAKNKDSYSTTLYVKLVFASNHGIQLAHEDDALVQRVLMLPFPYSVPPQERDRFLPEKLKAERAAIFRKSMYAFSAVLRRNYVFTLDDSVHPPVSIACSNHNMSQNFLISFLQCTCMSDPNAKVATADLFKIYQQMSASNGWIVFQNERDFGINLKPAMQVCFPMAKKAKTHFPAYPSAVSCYQGIKLLPGIAAPISHNPLFQ